MPVDLSSRNRVRTVEPASGPNPTIENAKRDWLARPDVRRIVADMDSYDGGAPLKALPRLREMVRRVDCAVNFLGPWVETFCGIISRDPLAQLPLRHHHAPGIAIAELLRRGRVSLTAIQYGPRAGPGRQTVSFASGERHELCLTGSAWVRIVSLRDASAGTASLHVRGKSHRAGDRLHFDNAKNAKLIDRVDRPLTVLRLSRAAVAPTPTREYRIQVSSEIHRASGDREESRIEMAMAVLGAMQRTDAADAINAIAESGSEHLRWQAVRHGLALDARSGFNVLYAIAADPSDPLSEPARALQAQLLARHPALTAREPTLCLA